MCCKYKTTFCRSAWSKPKWKGFLYQEEQNAIYFFFTANSPPSNAHRKHNAFNTQHCAVYITYNIQFLNLHVWNCISSSCFDLRTCRPCVAAGRGLRHWCQLQAVAESTQDEWDWRAHRHPVGGRRGQGPMESGELLPKQKTKKEYWYRDCSHGQDFISRPRQWNSSLISGEEDRGRGLRGDLRGGGSAESGHGRPKGGVGSAAQAGAEDGGGRVEEASGWVELQSQVFYLCMSNQLNTVRWVDLKRTF